MKRFFSVIPGFLLLAVSTLAVSAAPARPYANPTPCYGSTLKAEVDLNNPTESDPGGRLADPDWDTNEVIISLTANASGYHPYCYYSYTETATLYDSTSTALYGTFHIRVWACYVYQGDFSQSFINTYSPSFTTPYSWPSWNNNGECKKGADNNHQNFYTGDTAFFYVHYQGVGYLNY